MKKTRTRLLSLSTYNNWHLSLYYRHGKSHFKNQIHVSNAREIIQQLERLADSSSWIIDLRSCSSLKLLMTSWLIVAPMLTIPVERWQQRHDGGDIRKSWEYIFSGQVHLFVPPSKRNPIMTSFESRPYLVWCVWSLVLWVRCLYYFEEHPSTACVSYWRCSFWLQDKIKRQEKKRAKKWVEGKYIRMMIQLNTKVTGNRAALYILGVHRGDEGRDVDQKKKKGETSGRYASGPPLMVVGSSIPRVCV